jgi:hypothetical protein
LLLWEPRVTQPPNRTWLIDSAAARLSPSSRCNGHVLGDSDAGVSQNLGDHMQRRALRETSARHPSALARAGASGRARLPRTAGRRSARSCPGPSAYRPHWRRSARDPATAARPPSAPQPAGPDVAGTGPPARESA